MLQWVSPLTLAVFLLFKIYDRIYLYMERGIKMISIGVIDNELKYYTKIYNISKKSNRID